MALAHAAERVAVTESAVAHAINAMRCGLQHEARPQGVPAIAGAARRPVQGRLNVHPDLALKIYTRVPIQGLRLEPRNALAQDRVVAEGGQDARTKSLPQCAER